VSTTDVTTSIRDYSSHATNIPSGQVFEFGAPRAHYDSADSRSSHAGCMEWRAELRLSHFDAPVTSRRLSSAACSSSSCVWL
jgi:hypothetical protein